MYTCKVRNMISAHEIQIKITLISSELLTPGGNTTQLPILLWNAYWCKHPIEKYKYTC